jgi:hypothetical protein
LTLSDEKQEYYQDNHRFPIYKKIQRVPQRVQHNAYNTTLPFWLILAVSHLLKIYMQTTVDPGNVTECIIITLKVFFRTLQVSQTLWSFKKRAKMQMKKLSTVPGTRFAVNIIEIVMHLTSEESFPI